MNADNNSRKVILEVDKELESTTLIKLWTSDIIEKTEYVDTKILSYHGYDFVIIDLGSEELNLATEEQKKVCEYIIDHTLNSNVYNLAVATMNSDGELANQAIRKMLDSKQFKNYKL